MTEQEKYLTYLQTIKGPFQKLCRIRFLNPDGSTAFFVDNNTRDKYSGAFISDGSLTVNLQNGVRRTASVKLANSDGTFDREVKALLKITEVLECKNLLIITRDTERTVEINDKTIEVIPVWKWLLMLNHGQNDKT